jgi:hypothetical protein
LTQYHTYLNLACLVHKYSNFNRVIQVKCDVDLINIGSTLAIVVLI